MISSGQKYIHPIKFLEIHVQVILGVIPCFPLGSLRCINKKRGLLPEKSHESPAGFHAPKSVEAELSVCSEALSDHAWGKALIGGSTLSNAIYHTFSDLVSPFPRKFQQTRWEYTPGIPKYHWKWFGKTCFLCVFLVQKRELFGPEIMRKKHLNK